MGDSHSDFQAPPPGNGADQSETASATEETVSRRVSLAVVPTADSPYAQLGEVAPVHLTSFAYQIASGMVRTILCLWIEYVNEYARCFYL